LHPLIHAAGNGQGDRGLGTIGIGDEIGRVDGVVDRIAEEIAHGGRTDQRQKDIRARLHAIARQSVSK